MATEQVSSKPLSPVPPHVPAELVYDFDIFNPPGVASSLQDAWKTLQAPGVPDLIWTRCNGGHWIATRGQLIKEAYEDYKGFSQRLHLHPERVG